MILNLMHTAIGDPSLLLIDPFYIGFVVIIEYTFSFILFMWTLRFIADLFRYPMKMFKNTNDSTRFMRLK